MENTLYDIIGIGIGPFNLGMAAMADSIQELKCLFIDENEKFDWHPGLMLERARLQVPFYADLVTLADPRSRFSYFCFLKAKRRLFRFAIHENNFILRKEYNEYCQWVASQLTSLWFGLRCEAIHYDESGGYYSVLAKERLNQNVVKLKAKHIVLGVGSISNLPDCAGGIEDPFLVHSSDYLNVKERVLTKKSITIVGSGQSAAEIFQDLLEQSDQFDQGLYWFTQSDRFYPMEYSKLSLEMTSPDYIDHFFNLTPQKKSGVLRKQNMLYKGINFSLINEIYDELYIQSLNSANNKIGIYANCSLKHVRRAENGFELEFLQTETDQFFSHDTEAVIMATGYSYQVPEFLDPIKDQIQCANDHYQVNRNYSIDRNNRIFVQNAELNSHGFNAPDLGMGPYRNSVILNAICSSEKFNIEKNICFQGFGIPPSARLIKT